MLPHQHILIAGQALFGLLLVCWPVLDTAPTGAVTTLRIALGGLLLVVSVGVLLNAALGRTPLRWHPTDRRFFFEFRIGSPDSNEFTPNDLGSQ